MTLVLGRHWWIDLFRWRMRLTWSISKRTRDAA